MVGKEYQPLPTSDRTVSAFVKSDDQPIVFYLTWCLIVGLGGGEKGDSTALLLLQMFKHARKQVKFVDGKHKNA